MVKRNSYSKQFKEAIVKKILNRGSQTVAEVCAKEGVGLATASNWLKSEIVPPMKNKSSQRKKWSAEQKLKAVSETMGLSETDLGQYLRREGLYFTQLEEWKAQIVASLNDKPNHTSVSDEEAQKIKKLETQISLHEREILRKDKALAEVSALLILQKKVNLLWGDGDPK